MKEQFYSQEVLNHSTNCRHQGRQIASVTREQANWKTIDFLSADS